MSTLNMPVFPDTRTIYMYVQWLELFRAQQSCALKASHHINIRLKALKKDFMTGHILAKLARICRSESLYWQPLQDIRSEMPKNERVGRFAVPPECIPGFLAKDDVCIRIHVAYVSCAQKQSIASLREYHLSRSRSYPSQKTKYII